MKNDTKTHQEVIMKTNQKFAKFLGWELSPKGRKKMDLPPYGFLKVHPNYLRFHYYWNWLMLVVEKVEELGYSVTITQNICTIRSTRNGHSIITMQTGVYQESDTKISNTYKALSLFLELIINTPWYKQMYKQKT